MGKKTVREKVTDHMAGRGWLTVTAVAAATRLNVSTVRGFLMHEAGVSRRRVRYTNFEYAMTDEAVARIWMVGAAPSYVEEFGSGAARRLAKDCNAQAGTDLDRATLKRIAEQVTESHSRK